MTVFSTNNYALFTTMSNNLRDILAAQSFMLENFEGFVCVMKSWTHSSSENTYGTDNQVS
jgi:hypothetical protein